MCTYRWRRRQRSAAAPLWQSFASVPRSRGRITHDETRLQRPSTAGSSNTAVRNEKRKEIKNHATTTGKKAVETMVVAGTVFAARALIRCAVGRHEKSSRTPLALVTRARSLTDTHTRRAACDWRAADTRNDGGRFSRHGDGGGPCRRRRRCPTPGPPPPSYARSFAPRTPLMHTRRTRVEEKALFGRASFPYRRRWRRGERRGHAAERIRRPNRRRRVFQFL